MIRLAVRVTLLTLVLALLGCGTKGSTSPGPLATPDATVKAGDLLQDYSANAVAADAKYKGKILRVTGKFGTAQKAPLMGYAVQLLPEDAGDVNLTGVECFIVESAAADVGKLKQGDMITIQGTCDGQVLAQVKMSKCSLIK